MKKVIVTGATSGIGREVARVFARGGYEVGIVGRRTQLLDELRCQERNCRFARQIDVSRSDEAMVLFEELIADMGGVDIIVLNAGVGHINHELLWPPEQETIAVNAAGFAALANVAMRHFLSRGRGHLVGVSSLAAIRGSRYAPSYNASKAFVSNYLQGLRHNVRASGLPVTITDIQPGFVETALARGEHLFWVASAEKAARQIYACVEKRRSHAYITRRWRLVAWLLKALPECIYNRI